MYGSAERLSVRQTHRSFDVYAGCAAMGDSSRQRCDRDGRLELNCALLSSFYALKTREPSCCSRLCVMSSLFSKEPYLARVSLLSRSLLLLLTSIIISSSPSRALSFIANHVERESKWELLARHTFTKISDVSSWGSSAERTLIEMILEDHGVSGAIIKQDSFQIENKFWVSSCFAAIQHPGRPCWSHGCD